MLTLTENASNVVSSLVAQSAPTPGAGLRICEESPGSQALSLTIAEAPVPGDEVIEDHGARLFLDETASNALVDKILDADVEPTGGIQFSVAPQPGAV